MDSTAPKVQQTIRYAIRGDRCVQMSGCKQGGKGESARDHQEGLRRLHLRQMPNAYKFWRPSKQQRRFLSALDSTASGHLYSQARFCSVRRFLC